MVDEIMITEHWLNDNDKQQPKHLEKSLSNCHFIRHKSHADWHGN
jgi:hypothetical protein